MVREAPLPVLGLDVDAGQKAAQERRHRLEFKVISIFAAASIPLNVITSLGRLWTYRYASEPSGTMVYLLVTLIMLLVTSNMMEVLLCMRLKNTLMSKVMFCLWLASIGFVYFVFRHIANETTN